MAIERYSDRDFESLQKRIGDLEQWRDRNVPMIQKMMDTAAGVDSRIVKRITEIEQWKERSAPVMQKSADGAGDLSRRLEKADQQLETKLAALRKQVETLAKSVK